MASEIKVIGIDPGKDGGIALVGDGGTLLETWRVPKVGKDYSEISMVQLMARMCERGARSAAIEAFIAMPGLGSKTLVSIGVGHGLWRGAMVAAGLGYEIIRPQDWQAGIPGRKDGKGKSLKGVDMKNALKAEAIRRWPQIEQHSGICDAALIAEFYRRVLVGAA